MKIRQLFSLTIIITTVLSCSSSEQNDSNTNNDRLQDQKSVEQRNTEQTDLFNKLVEEAIGEVNLYNLHCPYCYSLVDEDVTICDSCGMDARNDAIVEMTDREYKNLTIMTCKACEKTIPDQSHACKYCTTVQ